MIAQADRKVVLPHELNRSWTAKSAAAMIGSLNRSLYTAIVESLYRVSRADLDSGNSLTTLLTDCRSRADGLYP